MAFDPADCTGFSVDDDGDLVCKDLTPTGDTDLSAGTVTLPANTIDSAEIAAGAVDPAHLASGYSAPGADAAVTLAVTDRVILLNSTTGAKAATMTATHAGHVILLRGATVSGGSYTFAVTGGDVTIDAANEAAIIVYSGSAWELVALAGATLV